MFLSEKIRAPNQWAWVRSFAPTQRYYSATGDDTDEAELVTISSQRSILPVPQVAKRETNTKKDPTVIEPFLEEATTCSDINNPSEKPAWIKGVYLCANATAVLLLLNVILVSVAGGLASKNSGSGGSSNSKVVYNGSCGITGQWNTALHFIINALSTGILAASNYCMQTLIAPTRNEIDLRHAKRRWLDIGGSSFRNLFAIPFNRLGLWLILMITATPFHLLYNSVIFESLSYNDYWTFVGPSDFDAQQIRNLTTPGLEKCFGTQGSGIFFGGLDDKGDGQTIGWDKITQLVLEGKSEAISTQQCYDYRESSDAGHFQSGYKGLILLSSDLSMEDGGDNSILWDRGTGQQQSVIASSFANKDTSNPSSPECDVSSYYQDLPLSGCLAFEGKKNCQLLFNPTIGVIISLTTLVKVITMFLAARVQRSRAPPLLTIGDAVASFLERPDSMTKGLCWASFRRIKKDWKRHHASSNQPQPRVYGHLSSRKHWRRASSPWAWLATSFIFSLGIGLGIGGSGGSVPYFTLDMFGGLWNSDENMKNFGHFVSVNSSELKGVVTANSVQLVVTVGYYFFNSVLTSMLASAEYSSYGTERKALRVTWPVKGSKQRSSYWLSVPYKYGIPVLLLFTAIHWLVSQGYYYVLMIPYGADDQPLYQKKISAVGVSFLPIFIAALLAFIAGILLLSLAFRRLKSLIPLAVTCSAAISAACHPPENVCLANAAHSELIWGETSLPRDCVDDENDGCEVRGHCSFTPLDAKPPSLEKLYS
ncbi:uncharacterized protein N7484_004498 [Penicillium longicatenatum]|uniref:uncharacterized protein n=1 Tax=Penicillium longicatenatum TaxID=1561947 RepID=UPI002546C41E|nr:uncharacterized protein N7484_004498 [Penicillium longicatenatum]KAJ5650775.1 hypothetical protein N7484_004498 [Penicillium longicatenatum]